MAGAPATNVKVNVAGTKLTINAAGTVNFGASTDVTVVLVDSAGIALANRKPVTLQRAGQSAGRQGRRRRPSPTPPAS